MLMEKERKMDYGQGWGKGLRPQAGVEGVAKVSRRAGSRVDTKDIGKSQ